MTLENFSDLKLGILGGGQLGKMLCLEACKWDIQTYVLDPSEDCPSSLVCKQFKKGDFRSFDDVCAFAANLDILTVEIEHVSIEALEHLKSEGLNIKPDPGILKIIQDKKLQKDFYRSKGLPTGNYLEFNSEADIKHSIQSGELTPPFVQKLMRMGYDGRGVRVVLNPEDARDILQGPSIIEEYVEIEKEISVIAVSDRTGDIRCFPPAEMKFNSKANLVEYLISPVDLPGEILNKAEKLAIDTVKAFGLCGILAVEMFLDKDNNLFINESAPRPHNSGHHTIESCTTSQYEQYLRCLFDLPLGSTRLLSPSVMINLLGEPGYEGRPLYKGLEQCFSFDGAKIHIYGKSTTKPYRKMGHVTVLDSTVEGALRKAGVIRKNLKVMT